MARDTISTVTGWMMPLTSTATTLGDASDIRVSSKASAQIDQRIDVTRIAERDVGCRISSAAEGPTTPEIRNPTSEIPLRIHWSAMKAAFLLPILSVALRSEEHTSELQ